MNRIPLLPLILAAVFLGLAPFFPEPHLWQKIKMLAAGELSKPIDIFDLLLHAAPILLLIVRLIWPLSIKKPPQSSNNGSTSVGP